MFPQGRTKQLFTALIIANIALAGAFVGLYYFLSNRAAATDQLSSRIDSIRNRQQRDQTVDQLVQDTATARDTLSQYFVPADGSASFITTVENIAAETRIDLQIGNVSIEQRPAAESASSEQEQSVFETLVLQLQARGSWERVVHFVRVLELLPKKSTVSDISFEQSQDPGPNDSTPLWSANLTVRVVKLTSQ